MKLPQLLVGIGTCLLLAMAAQAQTTLLTTLDWKFSVAGNPSLPTASGTTNLTGGAATASFLGDSRKYHYYFGTGPNGLYGTPTGLWAMAPLDGVAPELELKLDQTPVDKVDLTLVMTHFVDNSVYPGAVSFSVPGVSFVDRQVVVPQTGDMIGVWVADTYSWTGVTYPVGGDANGAPITLDLFPGMSGTGLFLDEVKLSILGAVSTVPEPMAGQLAGLGLLLFGLRSWLRRKG
jgi:hypothetical protein